MDSDDEHLARTAAGQRERELNKLRCGSTSPSAISTASSGSPLVRGHSGSSSGKRPAPTSIAAAQLQCQQSQLDFSTRLLTSQAASKEQAKHEAKLSRKAPESQQCGATSTSGEHHKSLGYRLAKSAAFRAYRLNELWSMNKMRYMNLACLLMTLICLVAILLLAGRSQQQVAAKYDHLPRNQRRDQLSSRRLNGEEPLAESIDSLDSQPLVIDGSGSSGGGHGAGSGSAASHDLSNGSLKWARSSPATSDREVEETTTASTTTSTSSRPSHTSNEQRPSPISSDSFGIEPLLNRVFNELELGPISLLDLLKKNSTKPFVKRTKNGATIIISASSNFNPHNDSSSSSMMPSLLNRMLPPFFRHNARQFPFGGGSTPLAELNPFNAASPSESRISFTTSGIPFGAARFGSFFGPMDPFMSPFLGAGMSQRRQSLFMDPPLPLPFSSMRQEFGVNPLGLSPSMMAVGSGIPPPGILNMLLKAHQDDEVQEEEEEGANFGSGNQQQLGQHAADTQLKNDTSLTTSQHQQNSTQSQPEASDQVVEMVTSRSRVQMPRPRVAASPSSGSMLVFSGGSLASPEVEQPPFMSAFTPSLTSQAGPPGFMPMMPQFLVLNGEPTDRNSISPMLKSLLGGLMSELSGAAQQQEHVMRSAGNKPPTTNSSSSGSIEKLASGSSPPSAWAEMNPDDDWMPASESSLDEQTSSKHLRAHHRNLDSELNFEPGDFLTGLDNIEKQILRTNQLSLGPHTRSQSLSRLDSSPPSSPFIGSTQQPARIEQVVKAYRSPSDTGPSIFLKPASERMDAVDMPPLHLSFIGRLLSELSRNKPENVITSSNIVGQQPMARGFAPRSFSFLSSGNVGELEDSEDSNEDNLSMFQPMQPPSKRVRVRIRPLASPHEPVPVAVSSSISGSGEDRHGRLNGKSSGDSGSQEANNPIERRSSSGDYSSQASESRVKHVLLTEHPFTSPSSPLFGFPAAPVGLTEASKQQVAVGSQAGATSGALGSRNSEPGSNRQQRSFTYHSNHEVAGTMLGQSQQVPHQQQPHHQVFIEGRGREGAVLGRRLDDSPAF